MENYNIAVIPGDGTGPEVIREGIKVLDVAADRNGFKLHKTEFDYGGERYLRTGETLPKGALDELSEFDAIYLGAIGHDDVKVGILEKGFLLATRFGLDQYINLRPVKLYPGVDCPLKDKGPEDIDFVVVRENVEGLYTGGGGFIKKGTPGEISTQIMVYTRKNIDRVLRFAYKLAQERKNKLTLCGKTNVLTYCYDTWERAFNEIGEQEFTDIKRDYAHVDAICMWMVKSPEKFDVIVTGNMFGDIITDLGAMIQGGLGIAAGGNLNPEGVSMFEPIGGSTPKYAGKNIINPLAAIEAGRMMLDHLGEKEAAKSIEDAVRYACTQMESLSAEKMGYSTTKVGDMVKEHVLES